MELGLAIAFSIAFSFTNGFHDAANAIATLVATRGARPGQAIVLSATFNMLGALLVGTAVADTIAGIVSVEPDEAVAVIGSGVLAATVWNVITWSRGLPSSSAHALVGGLAGAALAEAGTSAINWGGLEGHKPVGVLGVLIVLAISPVLGVGFGVALERINARALRRATVGDQAADPGGGVGDVGGALLRARRQRRPEVDGRGRGAAAGHRAHRIADRAALGQGHLRGGADARHRARRLADRPHDRPSHLPPGGDRRLLQPDRLDRGDPPRDLPRRARLHHPGGRLLGGRGRRRQAPLGATSAGPWSARSPSPGC